MAKEREIAEKFWKALRSDRTLMLGLAGVQEGHSQPMTAQLADDRDGGPIWFFTSSDTDLAKALGVRRANRLKTIVKYTGLPAEVLMDLAIELLDNVRDILTSAREVQLALESKRLNVVMKKVTSWAAIIRFFFQNSRGVNGSRGLSSRSSRRSSFSTS